MALSNRSIADVFEKLADLLDIEGANPFRIRAYRNAARSISDYPGSLVEVLKRGGSLTELPGIGNDLAGKVAEVASTGKLGALEEAKKRTAPGLTELLEIPGLGPRRIRALKDRFKVTDLRSLEHILKVGKLRELPGFGPKLEGSIREQLEKRKGSPARRVLLSVADAMAETFLGELKGIPGVIDVVAAGSCRRRRETVGDLDLLVAGPVREGDEVVDAVMEFFTSHPEVEKVLARGETKSSVVLRNGLQVDLRLVEPASFGAALVYFTGSKAHNIALRTLGIKRGLKLNEYGVYRGAKPVAGRTEEEVYAKLKLPWIPPELRENAGEIEAALKGELPRLVTLEDIRGDLHSHTTATDGRKSLEEMAEAAQARGYEYLAVTDHTRNLSMVHGQDPVRLRAQCRKIDKLNARFKKFRLLKSAEIDILEDGRLDLPDDVLAELDIRICSVHSRFNLNGMQQTERVLRAMDNPYFNILGHSTGRLIGKREAYAIDLDRVLQGARERGCFVELNSQPDRLDIPDIYCRKAKELGLKVAVSTDSHSDTELALIRYGIAQARRGWLEPEDVLNTRPWKALERLLRRK